MIIVSDLLAAKGTTVYTIAPDKTVFDALVVMAEKEVGALVVMSDDHVVGVISERDYARKVILKGRFSKDTLVKEIMTPMVASVTPSQRIEECMSLMTDKRLRHLPVVENGKLLGIISIGDLVKSIIEDQKFRIENLQSYINGSPGVL